MPQGPAFDVHSLHTHLPVLYCVPVRQKIVRGCAFVDIREARDLAADFPQTSIEEVVLEIAGGVKVPVGFGNRNLFGDHPGV